MSDQSSWNFTGNLCQDAKLEYTPSGTAKASLPIGINTGYGEHKRTTFPILEIWGKRAEALAQYLVKGAKVAITGEPYMNEWTTKDGDKRSQLRVNVSNVALLGNPAGQRASAPQAQQEPPQEVYDKINDNGDEDCPF